MFMDYAIKITKDRYFLFFQHSNGGEEETTGCK